MPVFFSVVLTLFPTCLFANNLYQVVKAIDGDTLKLSNGEHVQLIGIDTPESRDNPKLRRDAERTRPKNKHSYLAGF